MKTMLISSQAVTLFIATSEQILLQAHCGRSRLTKGVVDGRVIGRGTGFGELMMFCFFFFVFWGLQLTVPFLSPKMVYGCFCILCFFRIASPNSARFAAKKYTWIHLTIRHPSSVGHPDAFPGQHQLYLGTGIGGNVLERWLKHDCCWIRICRVAMTIDMISQSVDECVYCTKVALSFLQSVNLSNWMIDCKW